MDNKTRYKAVEETDDDQDNDVDQRALPPIVESRLELPVRRPVRVEGRTQTEPQESRLSPVHCSEEKGEGTNHKKDVQGRRKKRNPRVEPHKKRHMCHLFEGPPPKPERRHPPDVFVPPGLASANNHGAVEPRWSCGKVLSHHHKKTEISNFLGDTHFSSRGHICREPEVTAYVRPKMNHLSPIPPIRKREDQDHVDRRQTSAKKPDPQKRKKREEKTFLNNSVDIIREKDRKKSVVDENSVENNSAIQETKDDPGVSPNHGNDDKSTLHDNEQSPQGVYDGRDTLNDSFECQDILKDSLESRGLQTDSLEEISDFGKTSSNCTGDNCPMLYPVQLSKSCEDILKDLCVEDTEVGLLVCDPADDTDFVPATMDSFHETPTSKLVQSSKISNEVYHVSTGVQTVDVLMTYVSNEDKKVDVTETAADQLQDGRQVLLHRSDGDLLAFASPDEIYEDVEIRLTDDTNRNEVELVATNSNLGSVPSTRLTVNRGTNTPVSSEIPPLPATGAPRDTADIGPRCPTKSIKTSDTNGSVNDRGLISTPTSSPACKVRSLTDAEDVPSDHRPPCQSPLDAKELEDNVDIHDTAVDKLCFNQTQCLSSSTNKATNVDALPGFKITDDAEDIRTDGGNGFLQNELHASSKSSSLELTLSRNKTSTTPVSDTALAHGQEFAECICPNLSPMPLEPKTTIHANNVDDTNLPCLAENSDTTTAEMNPPPLGAETTFTVPGLGRMSMPIPSPVRPSVSRARSRNARNAASVSDNSLSAMLFEETGTGDNNVAARTESRVSINTLGQGDQWSAMTASPTINDSPPPDVDSGSHEVHMAHQSRPPSVAVLPEVTESVDTDSDARVTETEPGAHTANVQGLIDSVIAKRLFPDRPVSKEPDAFSINDEKKAIDENQSPTFPLFTLNEDEITDRRFDSLGNPIPFSVNHSALRKHDARRTCEDTDAGSPISAARDLAMPNEKYELEKTGTNEALEECVSGESFGTRNVSLEIQDAFLAMEDAIAAAKLIIRYLGLTDSRLRTALHRAGPCDDGVQKCLAAEHVAREAHEFASRTQSVFMTYYRLAEAEDTFRDFVLKQIPGTDKERRLLKRWWVSVPPKIDENSDENNESIDDPEPEP